MSIGIDCAIQHLWKIYFTTFVHCPKCVFFFTRFQLFRASQINLKYFNQFVLSQPLDLSNPHLEQNMVVFSDLWGNEKKKTDVSLARSEAKSKQSNAIKILMAKVTCFEAAAYAFVWSTSRTMVRKNAAGRWKMCEKGLTWMALCLLSVERFTFRLTQMPHI